MLQRTYPDDGISPSPLVPADIDMAELAARLGSPDNYRREGRVISIASFSPDLDGWVTNYPIYVHLTTAQKQSGNASMAIHKADHTTQITMEKYLPITTSLRFGLSFFCSIRTHAEHRLAGVVRMSNGVQNTLGGFRVLFANGDVSYYNSAGVWVSLGLYPNLSSLAKWVNFKIVVDFETQKYVRILINNIDAMSGIAPPDLQPLAPVAEYHMVCNINGMSTLAPNLTNMYIDSPIVTIHEY